MDELVRVSRRLAYVLRHHPEAVGLALDPAGWVELDDLLAALSADGPDATAEDVEAVMTEIPKQRFELRDGRIRAAYGHSVDVDLALERAVPPPVLFHGTVARFLPAIRSEGLRPRSRQHVHLSADIATARQVGSRRGRPVVLEVDAAAMHRDDHVFHRAAPGVWLTDHVPPDQLHTPTDHDDDADGARNRTDRRT